MNEQTPDHLEEELADWIDNAVPTGGYELTPLVGLGGSAGAISALQSFFASVPPNSGMAFVVVLHLAAERESILAEVLQRVTSMRVLQVQETSKVVPDTVYVIPPGKAIKSANGYLRLMDLETTPGRRMAVDFFFRALADTHGPHSAAVVLSGGDGDGAIGIKRIKERGGLTIAQDPGEAEHSSMPDAAIATGMVDWVLPVGQMASRLLDYYKIEKALRLPSEQGAQPVHELSTDTKEAMLQEVLKFLRSRTGRDFSYYKRATILRRIGRRMQVNGVEDLQSYLGCLGTRPGEANALLQDLLISVTNFFRDADCFEALGPHLAELFVGKGPNETVRIWVAACATGEEAYTIAMLLAEHARTLDVAPAVQIFASDLDDHAVQTAREGIYPHAIEADVSPERLRRFFVKEHGKYRVRRELREMVLFAAHDLLKDSPFSRLDMITCRNLLIYLDPPAQARVFEVLHFALLPHGRLFLGTSESVPDDSPFFEVLDKKHRIYAQKPAVRQGVPMLRGRSTLALSLDVHQAVREVPVVAGRAFEQPSLVADRSRAAAGRMPWGDLHLRLLEHLAPPSVVVDAAYDIVHLSASAGRMLEQRAGEPSRNLLQLAPSALRIELRTALHQASQSGLAVEAATVNLPSNGEGRTVTMQVVPVRGGGLDFTLVLFRGLEEEASVGTHEAVTSVEEAPLVAQLDQELERMRMHLRETVQQYETSTQELKASNEELQAINEELRSATEELETSREELQSINEELTTVNHELKAKVDELAHANSDMQNLMDATAIATIFLDRELQITRYTPSAVRLFNLIPGDVGRPLSDLSPQLQYQELGEDAQRVLERLAPIEREVGRDDGSWFLARLLPYRTAEDRIAGVVLSFINITERRQAEEVSQWLSAVVSSSMDAIISFSLDGTILSWNAGAQRVFGYAAREVVGRPFDILATSSDAPEMADLVGRVADGHSIDGFVTLQRAKDGSDIHVALTASPIADAQGAVVGGTAIARDIGDAMRAQEALRRSEERQRLLIESARDYAIFGTDLERVITSWNTGAERLLGYAEAEAVGRSADMIFTEEDRVAGAPEQEASTARSEARAADERFHLRKDGTRFWGSGTLMSMEDVSGGVIGFVKILRDETAARDAQEALQRSQAELLKALKDTEAARAELEEADSAKDRFIAVLSHELRNPLASVSSASTLLTTEETSDVQRVHAAQIIRRQARTMKILLDDLLDVSRLAVGSLELHRRDVTLLELIEAAVETAQPLIDSAQHKLSLELPDERVQLHVDSLRIGQVLVNLLTNAAKYTPPGGELWLKAQVDRQEVTLVVSDNGVGMSPDVLERIFDLYSQGPAASHRNNEGLGVGLALVRNIVRLHGGQVVAESDGPGRGSRFQIRLPLGTRATKDALPPSAAPPEVGTPRAARHTRVLIADDNADAAWSLGALLEAAGHETALATNGPEALAMVERMVPEVVILDIGMPGMSGIEVAQRLRTSAGGDRLGLIALTGWGGERTRIELMDQGFDAHLTKPVETARLVAVIEEVLGRREGFPHAD